MSRGALFEEVSSFGGEFAVAMFREFEVGGCLGESTPRVGTLSRRLLTPSMGLRASKVTGVLERLGRGNEKTRPSLAGSWRMMGRVLSLE